MEQGPLRDQKV